MNIVTRFPDYEFRTTIVPVDRKGLISYLTENELADTAEYIAETAGNMHNYVLQPFVARPRKNNEMVDERFCNESLEKLGVEARTSDELIRACYKAVKIILPNARIRGE